VEYFYLFTLKKKKHRFQITTAYNVVDNIEDENVYRKLRFM